MVPKAGLDSSSLTVGARLGAGEGRHDFPEFTWEAPSEQRLQERLARPPRGGKGPGNHRLLYPEEQKGSSEVLPERDLCSGLASEACGNLSQQGLCRPVRLGCSDTTAPGALPPFSVSCNQGAALCPASGDHTLNPPLTRTP